MATKHGVVIVVIAVLMGSGMFYAHNGLAASADISYSVLQVDPSVDPMAPVVPGSSSMLVRTDKGITMTIHTSGLQPGAAYTVWWGIFNNPEECAVPHQCVPMPDLGNPDVLGTVLNATGHVIGKNGVGNFAAHLAEGDKSGLSLPIEFPGDEFGLIDARKAMILLAVRTHGQPIPGQVKEQISMFNGGGCHDFESDPPEPDPTDACADVQFTVFP